MSYSVEFKVQVEFINSVDFGLDDDYLMGSEGDEDAIQLPAGTLYLQASGMSFFDDVLTPYLEKTDYFVEPSGRWVIGTSSRGEFFVEEEGQASSQEEGKKTLVSKLQSRIERNQESDNE